MKMKTNKNGEVFDSILKHVIYETVEEELSSFPSDKELNDLYLMTATDKKILESIAKRKRILSRQKFKRMALRIAACFCIFFTITTITLFSVEASRNFILSFFINIQQDDVVLTYEWHDTDGFPENFRYMGSIVDGFFTTSTYENAYGERILVLRNSSPYVARDEVFGFGHAPSTFMVDGVTISLFETYGDDNRIARWVYANVEYQISSTLSIDELSNLIRAITANRN